jgi:hypothetical protein
VRGQIPSRIIPDARHAADLLISGSAYEWLGQASLALPASGSDLTDSPLSKDHPLLAVGAPGHRNSSGHTVGAVHIFAPDFAGSERQPPVCLCSVIGGAHLGDFGASLAVSSVSMGQDGSHVLAVGSPGEGETAESLRAGVVRLLSLSPAFLQQLCTGGRNISLAQLGEGEGGSGGGRAVLQAVIRGPRLGRFGRHLMFEGTSLLVSAPLANSGVAFPVVAAAQRETGAIFGWTQLPKGGLGAVPLEAEKSARWHQIGGTPHGRLGSSLATMGGGGLLLAGAPLASTKVEMGGEVEVLKLPK